MIAENKKSESEKRKRIPRTIIIPGQNVKPLAKYAWCIGFTAWLECDQTIADRVAQQFEQMVTMINTQVANMMIVPRSFFVHASEGEEKFDELLENMLVAELELQGRVIKQEEEEDAGEANDNKSNDNDE